MIADKLKNQIPGFPGKKSLASQEKNPWLPRKKSLASQEKIPGFPEKNPWLPRKKISGANPWLPRKKISGLPEKKTPTQKNEKSIFFFLKCGSAIQMSDKLIKFQKNLNKF